MSQIPDVRDFPRLTVLPVDGPLTGKIRPPGSKSITNRALLLAGLSAGTSHIQGALKSLDTTLMARALRQMGLRIDEPDAETFVVRSTGQLKAPQEPLMLGNAGTTTRFLTAAAALADGPVVVDGDQHMRKRPIGPLTEALRAIGIDANDTGGCPPVTVNAGGVIGDERGVRAEIDGGLSSQYVSALLMIAPRANGPMDVALTGNAIGARGYVDLTVAAMEAFGASVDMPEDGLWRVEPTGYHAAEFMVEPDASAATYLWAAAALTGGHIDLGRAAQDFTQPDAKAASVIASFPDIPAEVEGSQIQDAVPTIAVLAAFNNSPVRFTGIANLRVKECDRVRALSTELNRIRPGLAREDGDDLVVNGDPSLAGENHPTDVETYADHRIAMSFALAGLKVHGITILDPACTGKTYPNYWRDLASLGVRYAVP